MNPPEQGWKARCDLHGPILDYTWRPGQGQFCGMWTDVDTGQTTVWLPGTTAIPLAVEQIDHRLAAEIGYTSNEACRVRTFLNFFLAISVKGLLYPRVLREQVTQQPSTNNLATAHEVLQVEDFQRYMRTDKRTKTLEMINPEYTLSEMKLEAIRLLWTWDEAFPLEESERDYFDYCRLLHLM